jgi:hypothetical protein
MDNIEDVTHPVSPSGQYFNTPILCSYVFGFLESEIPIDDSQTMYLFQHVFLPINPRFSSIMVHFYICFVYFLFTNFSYDIKINLYIYLYLGERQRWENEMEKSRGGS